MGGRGNGGAGVEVKTRWDQRCSAARSSPVPGPLWRSKDWVPEGLGEAFSPSSRVAQVEGMRACRGREESNGVGGGVGS